MMNTLIARFSEQLREAMTIGQAAKINKHDHEINKVYVAGLGGSGIGADFVSEFIRSAASVPYLVGKGYSIPAYVDQYTLAIASSYSGNTEETLSSFAQLQQTGAKLIVIASGGKLIQIAEDNGYDHIKLPDDSPSPRACLGYSLVQQLYVLLHLGMTDDGLTKNVARAADLLDKYRDDIKAEAKSIADRLINKVPIIYTTDRMESVAVRLRQQINENAKMLCWHHVIPEMNHNELVGWRIKSDQHAVLYLRNEDDYERNQIRININQQIIKDYCDTIIDVYSKGHSLIEKALYLVHLGDWISWYLSELRGVDSIEVKVIDYLKSELAKH